MMVLIIAFRSATSLPALNARFLVAWRDSDCPRGSITISLAPFLAAFLMKVAATGWFTVGAPPLAICESVPTAASQRPATAPALRQPPSAAPEEARDRRVQRST